MHLFVASNLQTHGFILHPFTPPMITLQHPNGLKVSFDPDSSWKIEHINELWLEQGTINDTSTLYNILKDYRVLKK
ncbi:hypothetical protein [Bacillus sp. Brlt_9]|uniref:hypothetical protein n=1 Tax=Bacillus sp. Brlt_9 TaxID=3110916 RepID=UPI003F7C74E9